MKAATFIAELPVRFVVSLFGFTLLGWIGWAGLILVALKFFGIIHWPWWAAALPLEYGVLYWLYMTIDGALYRTGSKDVGNYARYTQEPCLDLVRRAPSERPSFSELLNRRALHTPIL